MNLSLFFRGTETAPVAGFFKVHEAGVALWFFVNDANWAIHLAHHFLKNAVRLKLAATTTLTPTTLGNLVCSKAKFPNKFTRHLLCRGATFLLDCLRAALGRFAMGLTTSTRGGLAPFFGLRRLCYLAVKESITLSAEYMTCAKHLPTSRSVMIFWWRFIN